MGLHLSHLPWRRSLGLTVIAVVAWAGYRYLWPAHGVTDDYVGRCDDRTDIVVKSSAYAHPLSLAGDTTGYGLFLRTSARPADIPVYDDAFADRDTPMGFPSAYVGWNLAGWKWRKDSPPRYVGPEPTYEFAPVPQGLPSDQARIFELPSGPYTRDVIPPDFKEPLLMNIFLPPDKIDVAHFGWLADCLGRHQANINRALAGLGADFPYKSQRFYRPLRLGAIVRGMPPWSDPAYVDQIRSLYGDTQPSKALPVVGAFTLYKGQSASGTIDGKQVQLSILPTGETQWTIDGEALPDEAKQQDVTAAGLKDVEAVDGLIIGHSVCHTDKMDQCAKWITPHFWNNDGSTTFWLSLNAGKAWVNDFGNLAIYGKP